MRSHITRRFRRALQGLPKQVQRQARASYRLFEHDPFHPSQYFKRVHPVQPIYSVRIGVDYRAVGVCQGDDIIWFWIGSHEDYDRLLSTL
jgi:mRNA-degrading endonuclease RelE of RelBE toxin-antitoxin system